MQSVAHAVLNIDSGNFFANTAVPATCSTYVQCSSMKHDFKSILIISMHIHPEISGYCPLIIKTIWLIGLVRNYVICLFYTTALLLY